MQLIKIIYTMVYCIGTSKKIDIKRNIRHSIYLKRRALTFTDY